MTRPALTSSQARKQVLTTRRTANLERRPTGGGEAVYPISLYGPSELVVVETAFVWGITESDQLDGFYIVSVSLYVPTVSSSGDPSCDVVRVGGSSIFTTVPAIDAGEKFSDNGTVAVIDNTNNSLAAGDEFSIDVVAAGTDTLGMAAVFYLSQANLP